MKTLISKLLVAIASLVIPGLVMAMPPFIKGQLVVEGEPEAISSMKVIKKLPKSGLTVVAVESGKEFGQLQRLRKKGVRAGLNHLAQASLVPTDVYYGYQWHFPLIQAEQAWDMTRGQGVVVAVLDTGVVYDGPDGLNLCVQGSGNYDVVNADSYPSDGSDFSHGTHVAGTIAQLTSFDPQAPGTGTAGIAPEACVLPIKVLDDTGSGSFADIAEGIYLAVDAGAQIINMSLGVNARYRLTSDPLIDPALEYAELNNVLVVAAAGNDGYRRNVSYPAIYPTVVAVGATDFNNQRVGYSNRGTGLDLMAPGGDTSVDSNGDGYIDGVLQESHDSQLGFNYYFLQGTSMASPHVAGVAALMVASGFTDVTAMREALFASTLDLNSAGYDNHTGYGLVQAFNALVTGPGGNDGPPSAPSNPSPETNSTDVAVDVQLDWTAASDADSYQVYFGTTSLDLLAETSSTSVDPGPLAYDQNYQWQVRAINQHGETASSIWYFSTQAQPDDEEGPCIPTASNEKGPRGSDGEDNDCDGFIDGEDPH